MKLSLADSEGSGCRSPRLWGARMNGWMTLKTGRGRLSLLAAAAAVAAIVSGIAYATIPSGGVYTACKLDAIGTIRLIDPSLPASSRLGHCTRFESQVTWNQAGVPGQAGAKRDQGPAGIPGVKGHPGTPGSNGADAGSALTGRVDGGAIEVANFLSDPPCCRHRHLRTPKVSQPLEPTVGQSPTRFICLPTRRSSPETWRSRCRRLEVTLRRSRSWSTA